MLRYGAASLPATSSGLPTSRAPCSLRRASKWAAGDRWPAAFLPDLGECAGRIPGRSLPRPFSVGLRDVAEGMDAHFESIGRVPGQPASLAVKDRRGGRKRRVSPPMMATINGRPSVPGAHE